MGLGGVALPPALRSHSALAQDGDQPQRDGVPQRAGNNPGVLPYLGKPYEGEPAGKHHDGPIARRQRPRQAAF